MIGRHGERQSLRRLHAHRRDPDDVALAIEKRAAAVARIDGRIGLNDGDRAELSDGAHDAARHAVLQEAERRSNGHDFLARADPRQRSELHHRLMFERRRRLQHRQVQFRRHRRHAGRHLVAAGAPDHHRRLRADHVRVREDGVRRHEETAAPAQGRLDQHNRRHRTATTSSSGESTVVPESALSGRITGGEVAVSARLPRASTGVAGSTVVEGTDGEDGVDPVAPGGLTAAGATGSGMRCVVVQNRPRPTVAISAVAIQPPH